eukprot:5430800-Pleurochrysis_carterae.AAC.2
MGVRFSRPRVMSAEANSTQSTFGAMKATEQQGPDMAEKHVLVAREREAQNQDAKGKHHSPGSEHYDQQTVVSTGLLCGSGQRQREKSSMSMVSQDTAHVIHGSESRLQAVSYLATKVDQEADAAARSAVRLLRALEQGDIFRLEMLLKSGADVNTRLPGRDATDTLLIRSLSLADEDAAMLLLDFRASPHARDEKGQYPLLLAAEHGFAQVVTRLLELGTHSHPRVSQPRMSRQFGMILPA